MKKIPLSVSDVFSATTRIYPLAKVTPLIPSIKIKEAYKAKGVMFKAEFLQETGSFKLRGAANKIGSLSDSEKKRGVITFSTGNHGKAVSYVASSYNVPSTVCLSNRVPLYRVRAIEALGGVVVREGNSQDEAESAYLRIMKEKNLIPVVPFDDPFIASGQGTISLEIFNQYPDVDTLIVPLSGGGLLGGMAMAMKHIKPSVKIIGVSIKRSPAMLNSILAGKVVQVEEKDTIADSLLGGIGFENNYSFSLVKHYVDEHVVVDEDVIKEAMRTLFYDHGLVIEGGGAVTLAAIQSGLVDIEGRHVVMPLTGRNVDYATFLKVVQEV
ncbi:MAG: pyridoxal-phosphate dependent enzyme [Spirochaetia bacterium]|nr:pyridoxal-phosphate dependent enzyme [Spirochaetia bacterium]